MKIEAIELTAENEDKIREKLQIPNVGSPNFLEDVIAEAEENAPDEKRYMVVRSSHMMGTQNLDWMACTRDALQYYYTAPLTAELDMATRFVEVHER